jgi:autotransporter-associated beta strand protein
MELKHISRHARNVTCPLFFSVMFVLFINGAGVGAWAFQHPGIPLTIADLNDVKSNLTVAPWSAGYSALVSDGHSSTNYVMEGPFGYVNRNYYGTYDNENQWKSDMQAIFNLAIMWQLTGDANYAQKSHDILLAWANTMTNFNGIEAGLDLGDYATRYAGGADILRGTWPGWTTADTLTVSNFFVNVYIGTSAVTLDVTGPANKGSLQLVSTLAVAVFNDDTNLFNHVLYLYRTAASCGLANNSLTSGEMGETGRDQGHSYNHLLQMAYMAEMFWKQGVDVYSELDNRLLACGEYYARNNLSPAANYVTYGTTDALYWYNSTNAGGSSAGGIYLSEPTMGNVLRSAYVLRNGMTMPWTLLKRATQGSENGNSFLYLKSADTSTAAPPGIINYPMASTVTTGLLNSDIGGATPAGSASYSGGIWTVRGGGTEIWTHNPDSAHFTYKLVTGDCTIIAKVNSVQNTAGTAKAGVMIRDSLSSSAGNRAWVAVTAAQTAEAYMHGWTQCYGGSNWENASRGLPQSVYWVKLERHGNMINLYTSIDGTSWAVECAAQFNNMPNTVYLGLVVCSMNTSALNTATFSNVSITSGDGGNITVPPAPYWIYASPDAGQVPLRWLTSFGATSYNVLRSTSSSGPFSTIASGLTNASYVDVNVAPNTTYYYVVTASNSAGTSTNSPQDSATTQPVPPAPSGLKALPGNARVTLLWTSAIGATSYNVKRSTASGYGYVMVTNLTGNSFVDTGLVNGTTYYYVVSSVNASGEGPDSSQVSATPGASAAALIWSGTVNGTWDTVTTNWLDGSSSAAFADGNAVIFDDSASANTTISLSGNHSPSEVVFNNASKNYSIGGSAIAGNGQLIKQGSGSLTLNGANSYTGGTTFNGGTVTIGNASAFGTGLVTLNGGTLNNSANIGMANGILVSGNGGTVQLGSANNFTLTGTLTGSGNITLGGSWPLSSLYLGFSANTFSNGVITIPNSTGNNQTVVRFSAATAGSAAAAWSIGGAQDRGTTFDFGAGTISFGSLSGSGLIEGNSSGIHTMSVGALNTDSTFSGIIKDTAGTVGLTKVGSGTLTLTGANSYTAGTAVNAGSLVISTVSAANGNYTVANGATFGVTNVSSGSAAANNLSVAGGSTLEFQNVASTTTPLIAAGSVTVNGACTVRITGTNGLAVGTTYPLVSYSGAFSGYFTNLQLQMPLGWNGVLVSNANQIQLSVIAVPAVPSGLVATSGDAQVNLSWNASANATGYNVKRSVISGGPYATIASASTSAWLDTALNNGTRYYYVVSAVYVGGETASAAEVSAIPVSLAPVTLTSLLNGSQMQLSWPGDHTGWQLQAQTNASGQGLTTNWTTIAGSMNTNQFSIPVIATNGSVFFRLVSP